MMLSDLAHQIETRQRAHRLAKRSRLWRPVSTPATDLGYRCVRRIVYHRTLPEKAKPISEELASIFEEGKIHETQVKIELAELGFEVVETEVHFRDEALDISGAIDGKIQDVENFRRRHPIEIKGMTGDPPKTEEALKYHSGIYGRYYCQMQCYLYLTDVWEGLFIFKSKTTGLYTVVPVVLDLDLMEGLLKKAEAVRDHVRAGTLPEPLADRSECFLCPWRDTECHPEEHAPDPMLLAVDDELEAQILRREELDGPRKEFAKLHDLLRTRFKMTKGDRFLCGDFVVEKKPHGKGTRVDFKRVAEKAAEMEGVAREEASPLEDQQ